MSHVIEFDNVIINQKFGFLIIDDLIPVCERNSLFDYAIRENFFYQNSFEWTHGWHPLNGQALLTSHKSYGKTNKAGPIYPTGTPYDAFFDRIAGHSEKITEFLGISAEQFNFIVSAFLYRSGWGIPWHEDLGEEGEYNGALIYYLHKEWRGNWGGELMVLAEDRYEQPSEGSIDLAFIQGTGLRSPSHVTGGVGTFILPKPNRLVVMRPGLVHSVNSVSPLAGEAMRFSLAGFYV